MEPFEKFRRANTKSRGDPVRDENGPSSELLPAVRLLVRRPDTERLMEAIAAAAVGVDALLLGSDPPPPPPPPLRSVASAGDPTAGSTPPTVMPAPRTAQGLGGRKELALALESGSLRR